MRLMMKFTIPTERGNRAAEDGSMQAVLQEILEDTKPEAAYFSMLHGKRYCFLVIEEEDQARLMQHNEKLMRALDAEIHYGPALTVEDLARGFQ